MPSPFPGMNPYLERRGVWADFHNAFIIFMRVRLAAAIRARHGEAYTVLSGESLFVHDEADDDRRRVYARSDVGVTGAGANGSRPASNGSAAPGAAAVVDAPTVARFATPVVEESQYYVEIRDREGDELVTLVEALSPSNKAKHRDAYLVKRSGTLASGANLVEIDLLRGHGRVGPIDLPPCDYYALVSRPADFPQVELWPVMLRDRLPTIAVPLREGDDDVPLDLQSLLHETYDACSYGSTPYRRPPEPPLPAADRAWADALVAGGSGSDGG